jgi:DNA helicase-2/ATP-dependent DNA helicase PcrA
MPQTLSPQGQAIISAVQDGRENLIIQARAGCGKTTILTQIVPLIKGESLFCAFNKSIVKEIEERTKPLNLKNLQISTIHSAGFGILKRNFRSVKVDNNKLGKLARKMFSPSMIRVAVEGAAMAKNMMPESFTDWERMFIRFCIWDHAPHDCSDTDAIIAAQRLLEASNQDTKTVDFSDMIYLPVIMDHLKIWQYDNVLLDEAQDTNKARRKLVKLLLKSNGRLFAVGDDRQAIYGFTGADHDSLEFIKEEFQCIVYPLNVTYRCPKIVVDYAHRWVDDIHAHESAPEGNLKTASLSELSKLVSVKGADVILCRNTAPLIKLAYKFIREGIPCKVAGRKVGENLIKLTKKWKVQTVSDLNSKLDSYLLAELEKFKKKGSYMDGQDVTDRVDTLRVFIEQCEPTDSVSVLVDMIEYIFSDDISNCLELSTIHKSKGKEWENVYLLGNNKYIPSKYAKTDKELRQEENLAYVSATRAKHTLVVVDLI